MRKITNIFKNTNIRLSFRSTNTIKHLTKRKTNNNTPDYDKAAHIKSSVTLATGPTSDKQSAA
jgi:hypothetical protein